MRRVTPAESENRPPVLYLVLSCCLLALLSILNFRETRPPSRASGIEQVNETTTLLTPEHLKGLSSGHINKLLGSVTSGQVPQDPRFEQDLSKLAQRTPHPLFRAHTLRQHFSHQKPGVKVEALLYSDAVQSSRLSGTINIDIPSLPYKPNPNGTDLQLLKYLPSDIEKLLLMDPRGLQIDDRIRQTLVEQWKRWEFDPYRDLASALGETFCYGKWKGKALLGVKVDDPAAVKLYIEKRFPSSVTRTTAKWAYGCRIQGFEKSRKPAWFFRGDHAIITPVGGITRLSRMLQEGYGKDNSFQPESGLLQEFYRLSSSEERWHICAVDQSSSAAVHWALLLKFSASVPGKASGFIVVEQPNRVSSPASETDLERQ